MLLLTTWEQHVYFTYLVYFCMIWFFKQTVWSNWREIIQRDMSAWVYDVSAKNCNATLEVQEAFYRRSMFSFLTFMKETLKLIIK